MQFEAARIEDWHLLVADPEGPGLRVGEKEGERTALFDPEFARQPGPEVVHRPAGRGRLKHAKNAHGDPQSGGALEVGKLEIEVWWRL